MNKRIKKKQNRIRNKKLCERYPFLTPRNVWTGEFVGNYDWTLFDEIPTGWRKAFGKDFVEELRDACIETDFLNELFVTQIKEKYGSLRFYVGAAPEAVHQVIEKYEDISERRCICCGRPVDGPINNRGWIEPICERCLDLETR